MNSSNTEALEQSMNQKQDGFVDSALDNYKRMIGAGPSVATQHETEIINATRRLALAIIQEQESALTPTCVFCGGVQDEYNSHNNDCDYVFALEIFFKTTKSK